MLALSEEAIDFYSKVARGDKVIWQSNLRLLCCFGSNFKNDWSTIAGGRYYDMYEPLFWQKELHLPLLKREVIGIQFYCADAQLAQRPCFQQSDLRKGLMVSVLLSDAISFLQDSNFEREHWVEMSNKLIRFTQEEKLCIPPKVVLEIIKNSDSVTH